MVLDKRETLPDHPSEPFATFRAEEDSFLSQAGYSASVCNVEHRDVVAGPRRQLHLRTADGHLCVLIQTPCQGKINLELLGFGLPEECYFKIDTCLSSQAVLGLSCDMRLGGAKSARWFQLNGCLQTEKRVVGPLRLVGLAPAFEACNGCDVAWVA